MPHSERVVTDAPRALSIIDRRTLIRLVRRTLVLWILVHIAIPLIGAFGSSIAGPYGGGEPDGSFNLAAVLATAGLLVLDVRVLNEQRLLANVGIGARTVAAVGFIAALALELALAAGLAAVR